MNNEPCKECNITPSKLKILDIPHGICQDCYITASKLNNMICTKICDGCRKWFLNANLDVCDNPITGIFENKAYCEPCLERFENHGEPVEPGEPGEFD